MVKSELSYYFTALFMINLLEVVINLKLRKRDRKKKRKKIISVFSKKYKLYSF